MDNYEFIEVTHNHEAVEKAVEMAKVGEVLSLMKEGSLHTDELMSAVVKGLRTECQL